MTITITNSNGSSYLNFQVRDSVNTQALISAGKMKADGGDIRFADSLCNLLSYFVQSGINTTGTIIWVKISSLPANGTRIIYMFYGNPAGTSQSSGNNTFAFYEGFDNNNLGRFGPGPVCSQGTPTSMFNNGIATFSWTANVMWVSDSAYSNSDVYTAEANVTAANGNWPGLYWARSVSPNQSMAVLMGSNNVRVSKTPIGGTNYCNGHNFVQPTFPVTTPVGLWSFTWIAAGSQVASFPGLSQWTTTDAELPRDVPLKICLGGISSGTGSYSIDWVRARKYSPVAVTSANGSELSAPQSPGNSLTATVLSSTSIRINWADSSSNEDRFMIERSTNGGTTWGLRDSVPANSTQYIDNGLTQNTQYCYRVYAKNCMGNSANSNQICATTFFTGISHTSSEIPKVYNLYQNFPNPFNPVTNIKFDIPKNSYVRLVIYDALGREVTKLIDQHLQASAYSIDWNATSYASGIYFYKIEARQDGSSTGDYIKEMKMVLVK
ncbi:MAG TPA: DUF2341 domain-containing protein [Ignavibacteria bacterium]